MGEPAATTIGDYVVGLLVLVIFLAGAAALVTRRLPALITLPLMAVGIVGGTAIITHMPFYYGPVISLSDLLNLVLPQGITYLAKPIIIAFLGGMLSFIMQKSGVAHSLVKQGAELIGDNPLAVACFSLTIIAMLFTTIAGLGAVIMVALVVLPMLATVGVPPTVAGGILLIGLSMGGIMNPQAWALYVDTLKLPLETVRAYALTLFLLLGYTGIVFICVELIRSGALRQYRQAAILLIGGGVVIAGIVGGIAFSDQKGREALPIFSSGFEEKWVTYDEAGRVVTTFGDNEVQFALHPPFTGTVPVLSAASAQAWQNSETLRKLAPTNLSAYENISFTATSDVDASLEVTVRSGDQAKTITAPLAAAKSSEIRISAQELQKDFRNLSSITGIEIGVAGLTSETAANVKIGGLRYKLLPVVPMWKKVLRVVAGVLLAIVVIMAVADLFKRVRYWRKQIVEIKWYTYLIPVVPLVLIILFNVDIIAAFLLGFVYAVLVTARPGTVSMTIQSMIQGANTVMPAAILMLGIGVLLVSVLGPAGWSDLHEGAKWPVLTAVQPLFKKILPTGPIYYVIVFSICAPLALYRGPLNTWGLGFGVANIMIATGSLPAGAIMAMLMTVGQIQGICDPTNTHNVWLANELRVDVNGLMLKTLPYAWGLVIVGLTIASFRYFG